MFVIAAEGIKTEQQYFAVFDDRKSLIQVRCLRHRSGNSPPQVLKRLQDVLNKESLRSTDEAWLVVDKDQWTEAQLMKLHAWCHPAGNRGLAVSNPKFEYWLLLHFEDGAGVVSSHQCSDRLERHLPGYDKSIDRRQFSEQRINDAVRRAKSRDIPPCTDWPRAVFGTTVYRLVENIIRARAG